MIDKAPKTAPFLSVAAVFLADNEGATYRGSAFLLQTQKHQRQDIVLGAGHNLQHLSDKTLETQLTFYAYRDVLPVAQRANDSFRYAVAGTALPSDFGVAVLAEALPTRIVPLMLITPDDAEKHDVGVAGSVAAEAAKGDMGIYVSETTTIAHGHILFSDTGVTAPGMSGGPVFPIGRTAQAIGLVHGAGTINLGNGPVPADLYVAMTKEHIARIDSLIDTALAG